MSPTTTTSFSQKTPLVPGHLYEFGLSCSNEAGLSQVNLVVFGGLSTATLRCGQAVQTTAASFQYFLFVRSDPPVIRAVCAEGFVNTTGDFKCRSKKWAATLTVTDLSPLS